MYLRVSWGFPRGSSGKESAFDAEDPGLIPGSGRSPGEGIGYPLQYSCQRIPMDRGAWWATVHGVTKSRTQLSSEHYGTSLVAQTVKNLPVRQEVQKTRVRLIVLGVS